MKWADFCVMKLTLNDKGFIDNVLLCKDLGDQLDSVEIERNRDWMVQQVSIGKSFCSIKKDDSGSWRKIGDFNYNGSLFSWYKVPKNIIRRKTFVSYYHHDDQEYREKFENLFGDLIVSKSVEKDDIDSDNSDEYIKQLIQKEYLSDTTVLVVLLGPNTRGRMHVDWEISGALNLRVGGSNAGLLGIKLPDHPDFGTESHHYANLPSRLADNLKTGYALIRDWTDDRILIQSYIEEAFSNRASKSGERVNSRIQMTKDTCE